MSGTPWIAFNIVLFSVVGLQMAYIAIRYKTYEARLARLPRMFFCISALANLLWATGWVFQLHSFGVLETGFKTAGAILFVLVAGWLIFFRRKAAQPTG
jgi:hypothetical protein